MRLVDWLDRGASFGRERVCVVDGDRSLTYAQVIHETRRIGAALRHYGVGHGSRAAVLGPNSAMALVAVLGIGRSGAAWIPANARATVDELAYVLEAGSCQALLYDAAMGEVASELKARVPTLDWVVSLDELAGDLPGDANPLGDPPEDPTEVALLGFTGGTTGRPKGVILTIRNLEAMIVALLAAADLGSPPVYLAAAPLTHAAGGLCFPTLACGGTVIVHRSVEPTAILDAIEQHEVTFLYLPPTAIYMLLAEPTVRQRDYSTLRCLLYASAPMAPERVREAIDVFGPVMVQTFGQTEAPMICTVLTAADHAAAVDSDDPERLASCGRQSVVARVAAMSDDGTLLPPREAGEIVVRGSLVMAGYLDDPDANAEVSAHGWHHTGDVGFVDEAGYVYLVDRKKDMIVTGGFNVFSAEVEQAVLAHSAVQQCAVIGAPDDKWGEVVTAVVELKPGASLDADDLIASCKQAVGSIKAPKRVEVWKALPRSSVGKILKRDIRASFWEGRDRAI